MNLEQGQYTKLARNLKKNKLKDRIGGVVHAYKDNPHKKTAILFNTDLNTNSPSLKQNVKRNINCKVMAIHGLTMKEFGNSIVDKKLTYIYFSLTD